MNREAVLNYVKRVTNSPFIWGELDCTLFPARCLDALQEKTNVEKHAGKWSDIKSAVRYAKKHKLTLESWLMDNGCVEIETNYQQTGDFLMMNTITIKGHEWLSAAVCLGTYSAVCTEEGVQIYKTADIEHTKVMGVRSCLQQ